MELLLTSPRDDGEFMLLVAVTAALFDIALAAPCPPATPALLAATFDVTLYKGWGKGFPLLTCPNSLSSNKRLRNN